MAAARGEEVGLNAEIGIELKILTEGGGGKSGMATKIGGGRDHANETE